MGNKYKDTLLLGQTNFEMRAGLKTKEPIIEKAWDKDQIYQKKLKLNYKKPLFMLHDGPPYANGDLHIGHALNKSLKDFIVRWKNATGFQAPFILGWDTHGLPIETAVTKTGVDRKKLSPWQFRQLCEKYALSQVENQMQQFMRLGVFTDPETNYLTLRPEFELTELRLFAKMYEKGLIYKALKPIYWSPSSESALAESEVEYANVKSPSVFVACDLVDQTQFPANTSVVVWTTTPWTLPVNQLIAVGSQLNYSLIKPKNDDRHFIVASSLVESVAEQVGWEKVSIKAKLVGDDLIGLNYAHPLYPQKVSQIVAGHHVSDDAGTGLVHTAGGFGEDDYLIVKKHGLAPFAPIDNQGKFTWEINDPELTGQFYDDTNKIIVNRLKESGNLLKLKFVTHSYPHDWRTKKPVIYRATLQWFINLNQSKDQILKHVDQIQTNPSWAKQRLYQVLDDRVDWTISRQRLWGVPIVAFYDKQDQLVLNDKILAYALQKIAELGTNAWFEEKADVFLPKEYQNQNLRKEKDILDVWFDSGSTALALEAQFPQFKRPYDLYLEGNDQYRGWFNASMINSVIYDNQSPYKTLISHGMTTDEKGHKMSKSLGNGIDPIAFSNDLGADILRLWVASTDYTDDQKIGPEIIKQVSESYRKIRNTLRFIMANLNDFDPKTNYQKTLNEVDEYALYQLTQFKNQAMKAYDTYQFNNVYTAVLNYVTKDLSAFYLDFIKDILYVEKADGVRRRQVQTVLFEQFWALIDILRPILVHTVEEAYQTLNFADQKSVHLLDVREQDFKISSSLLKKWNLLMELKNDINKALEEAKIQGVVSKSFEASVKFALKPEFKKELSKIPADLAQIFIVSQIEETTHDKSFQELNLGWFKVEKRVGEKCQRCWAIYDTLATEDLCDRCYNVINTKKG